MLNLFFYWLVIRLKFNFSWDCHLLLIHYYFREGCFYFIASLISSFSLLRSCTNFTEKFRICNDPANICLFNNRINNKDTYKNGFKILSKLKIKTPNWSHWRCSDVFIDNFEQIICLVLGFLLLTLSMYCFGGLLNLLKFLERERCEGINMFCLCNLNFRLF